MSSYATCNAHSTCYSSGEFCDNSNDCMACASYDQSDSIDNQKPAWCNDYDAYGLGEVYISNSYTLRNTQKRAYDPSSPQAGTHCPTLDACASQCTETYQVTKTDAVIIFNTLIVVGVTRFSFTHRLRFAFSKEWQSSVE